MWIALLKLIPTINKLTHNKTYGFLIAQTQFLCLKAMVCYKKETKMFMHLADAFIQSNLQDKGVFPKDPYGRQYFHEGDLNPGHLHERWQSYHYTIQYRGQCSRQVERL